MRNNQNFDLRKLIVTALLIAMYVVLDRIVPGVKTMGTKLVFSFIVPIIAAVLYGPIIGAAVYGFGDLIAALLFPYGPYHVGFTVVAAVMGFVLGVFLHKQPFKAFGSEKGWEKLKLFPNVIVPIAINCLVLGLLVNTLWVAQLYGSKTYWGWFVYRLPQYAIMLPAQMILTPLLIGVSEQLKKAGVKL